MKTIITTLIAIQLVSISGYANECVILLHGLTRSNSSMHKLETVLENEGFRVVNVSYPSRYHQISELANEAIPSALQKCPLNEKVNFVTHSMGGILVRQYLSKYQLENLNHVIMLGPPNQGSEVVDKLSEFPGFQALNGPAGLQLGTGEMSIPKQLGPVDFSLGIIAGSKSVNLILSTMMPKPNDGKVSVESTKVEGMSDHIVMPVTHPFMMKNSKVIKQVIYFLKYGEFEKA